MKISRRELLEKMIVAGIASNWLPLALGSSDREPARSLEDLARFGLATRLERSGIRHPLIGTYVSRLEQELTALAAWGDVDLVLQLQDLANQTQKLRGRLTSGRGSTGCLLTAYALNITDIDPVEHKLPFGRVLRNPAMSRARTTLFLGVSTPEIVGDLYAINKESGFADRIYICADEDSVRFVPGTSAWRFLESMGARSVPEIAAAYSLYRSGPLLEGADQDYRSHRYDNQLIEISPESAPILSESRGVLLYDEQVIRILMATFHIDEQNADLIRRDLAKLNRASAPIQLLKDVANRRGWSQVRTEEFLCIIEARLPRVFCQAHAIGVAMDARQYVV